MNHFKLSELLVNVSELEKAEIMFSVELSGNLFLVKDMLNCLRDVSNLPLVVNSVYRNQSHNERVNGSRTSQHLTCSAADVRPVPNLPSNIDKLVSCLSKVPNVGQVIIHDTFIHIGLSDCALEKLRFYTVSDKRTLFPDHEQIRSFLRKS